MGVFILERFDKILKMYTPKHFYWMKANALALSKVDNITTLRVSKLLASYSHNLYEASVNSLDLPLKVVSSVKGRDIKDFDTLNYSVTPFYWTNIVLASTRQGVCFLGFIDNVDFEQIEADILKNYPNSKLREMKDKFQSDLLDGLMGCSKPAVSLHICGTDFQIKVWSELIQLKPNELVTYKDLATRLGKNKAYRAVGTAVGQNPVSILIPCHRVVGSNDKLAGYRWGLPTKLTLLIGEKGIHE